MKAGFIGCIEDWYYFNLNFIVSKMVLNKQSLSPTVLALMGLLIRHALKSIFLRFQVYGSITKIINCNVLNWSVF